MAPTSSIWFPCRLRKQRIGGSSRDSNHQSILDASLFTGYGERMYWWADLDCVNHHMFYHRAINLQWLSSRNNFCTKPILPVFGNHLSRPMTQSFTSRKFQKTRTTIKNADNRVADFDTTTCQEHQWGSCIKYHLAIRFTCLHGTMQSVSLNIFCTTHTASTILGNDISCRTRKDSSKWNCNGTRTLQIIHVVLRVP